MFGSASPIDHNLILTGYSGPGQLAIARRIAERLRMRLVDFPTRFEERIGVSAEELQAQYGESRVKAVETELITEIALNRGAVIHIGGQALLHSGHYATLSATGPVICLVATLDAVLQRLHLALGARFHDPRERGMALANLRREWAIRHTNGSCEIDTSIMDENAIIDAVVTRWREITGVIDWRVISTTTQTTTVER